MTLTSLLCLFLITTLISTNPTALYKIGQKNGNTPWVSFGIETFTQNPQECVDSAFYTALAISSLVEGDRLVVVYAPQNLFIRYNLANSQLVKTNKFFNSNEPSKQFSIVCPSTDSRTFDQFTRRVGLRTGQSPLPQFSIHYNDWTPEMANQKDGVVFIDASSIQTLEQLDDALSQILSAHEDSRVVITSTPVTTPSKFTLFPKSDLDRQDLAWKQQFQHVEDRSISVRAAFNGSQINAKIYPSYFDSGFFNLLFAIWLPVTVMLLACCCFCQLDTPGAFETGHGKRGGFKL